MKWHGYRKWPTGWVELRFGWPRLTGSQGGTVEVSLVGRVAYGDGAAVAPPRLAEQGWEETAPWASTPNKFSWVLHTSALSPRLCRDERYRKKEKENEKEKEKEKEKGLQQQECPFLGSIVVVYDQAPVQEGWVAAVGLHEMALQLMPFEEPTRVVCYLRGW